MWRQAKSVYEFSLKTLAGVPKEEIALSEYKGKVLFIVNVASKWGVTKSNYEQLNTLHKKYAKDGLVILAQPSNEFGAQEPLEGSKLLNYIKASFCNAPDTEFQFFERAEVNGENALPLWLYLQNHPNTTGSFGNGIKWNFTKFLVDKNGQPMKRFGTKDGPLKAEKDIIDLLAEEPVE